MKKIFVVNFQILSIMLCSDFRGGEQNESRDLSRISHRFVELVDSEQVIRMKNRMFRDWNEEKRRITRGIKNTYFVFIFLYIYFGGSNYQKFCTDQF